MGTRNLTIIKIDNEIKVAQYGQWDGYPTGQGKTIAKFFSQYGQNIDEFKTKVRNLRWLSKKEHNAILKKYTTKGWMTIDQGNKFNRYYPHLTRDNGAKILFYIMNKKIKGLINNIDFLKDGLFCEWAYEIDLDNNIITVLKSGNNIYAQYDIDKFTVEEMVKLEEKYEMEEN
jgi:hypothetical protein